LLVLTGGVTGAFCDFAGMPAELTSVVAASITVLARTFVPRFRHAEAQALAARDFSPAVRNGPTAKAGIG
jgi:hypothetical protein